MVEFADHIVVILIVITMIIVCWYCCILFVNIFFLIVCPVVNGEVCGPHGDCSKNHSSPFPCDCHSGYHWNTISLDCIDTNECTEGLHDCIAPAICVNTIGSYRCKCPSLIGWSFDGRRCYDTDECQYTGVCSDHTTCQNYPGGYR